MSDKLKKLKTLGYTAPVILPMAYFAGKALKKAKQDKGAQEKKANLNKLLTKLANAMSEPVESDLIERGLGGYQGAKRGMTYGYLGGLLSTELLREAINKRYGTRLPYKDAYVDTSVGVGGLLGAVHGALKPESYYDKGVATTALRSAAESFAPLMMASPRTNILPMNQVPRTLVADQAITQYARKRFSDRRKRKQQQEKKANLNKLLTKLAKPVNPKVLQAGGVGLTALSLLGLGKAEKKRKALQKIHSEQSNKYVEPTDRKLDELYDRTMAEMDKGRHLGDYKGKPVDQYTRDAIFFNDHDKEFSAERDRLQTKLYEDRMNFQNRATSKEHFNRVNRMRRLENLARVGAALGTVGAGYGMYRDLFKK